LQPIKQDALLLKPGRQKSIVAVESELHSSRVRLDLFQARDVDAHPELGLLHRLQIAELRLHRGDRALLLQQHRDLDRLPPVLLEPAHVVLDRRQLHPQRHEVEQT